MQLDLLNPKDSLAPLALPLPSGTSRRLIADGPRGTTQTIEVMQKLVNSGKHDNAVRELCGKILNPINGVKADSKNYFQYADRLYSWVRNNILYAYDPVQLEYCEGVRKILANRIGDCDSMDILLCAMFEHVGLPAQFVTVKADASRPDEYSHVYTRVKVPGVGWVCADPIMHKKWFGWEPPYPSKKYWPASSDELDHPVDTTPSVQIASPGATPEPAFDLGISGLEGLGKGGHGHHGGGVRGQGGRWGGGWSYGPGWGDFDDNVYILPVIAGAVALPDMISVVPGEDTDIQALENPLTTDQSVGMSANMAGFFDDAVGAAKGLFAQIAGGVLSNSEKANLLARLLDGSLAREITARRSRTNANSDLAYKYLQAARKSGNSDALGAANSFADAVRSEQYALNATVAKYNEAAGIVASASGGKVNVPKVGMGADAITYTVIGLLAIASVSAAIIALSGALSDWANASAKAEAAKAAAVEKNVKLGLNPADAARAVYGSANSIQATGGPSVFESIKQAFSGGSQTVGNYVLLAGGLFIGWQVLKYAGGIADAKIRSAVRVP